MQRSSLLGRIGFSAIVLFAAAALAGPLDWPEISTMNKPWTRWWWMGSAVDKPNIDALLQQYHDAGVGGVEICPIYGAIGAENRYIQYLSPQWMDMLNEATAQAKNLGMDVDMTTGTGWPMGGPETTEQNSSSTLVLARYNVAAGQTLQDKLTGAGLQCVYAISDNAQQVDLTDKVAADGTLNWTAPDGNWRIYAVGAQHEVMKVKRPAPGGDGWVIDPFSVTAMDAYLAKFDKAFSTYKGLMPLSQFHDSYEYVGNDTPDLFDQFQKLRGYDLRTQLPALAGEGSQDTVSRVLCDYRQTMAQLHEAYVQRWVDWCHSHGMLAREQAHGAPTNLLDLYAEADTPETETFGPVANFSNMPMNQFASSAAHVTGKQLASSESFTWLGEHFQVSFKDVKPVVDYLFLSGINHMLFHGMAYSPKDVAWPGWLFYAAVDFNPNGGLWHDLPTFTAYAARCQSILQQGKPDNDVLLYFPVWDVWQRPRGQLIPLVIGGAPVRNEPFYGLATTLESHGFTLDLVSDKQISNATVTGHKVMLGGNSYRAVVIPPCTYMPPETAETLVRLARAGATVVVQGNLPTKVPGLADQAARQDELTAALAPLGAMGPTNASTQGIAIGNGTFWIAKDANNALDVAGVQRETMLDKGLRYIRRARADGYDYFLVNPAGDGAKPIDGWVQLSVPAMSAVILDPMRPDDVGVAEISHDALAGVRLQMLPGESRFVRTYTDEQVAATAYAYWKPAGDTIPVSGNWGVHFIEGGPKLPADYHIHDLDSWTKMDEPDYNSFAGTARYTVDVELPAGAASDYRLDLGTVHESARVTINGTDAGTVIADPFSIDIHSLFHPGHNTLQIDVTNLATNRIEDLDRRGVNWKIFRDINIVNHNYSGVFDSSDWPLRDSGLMGPVTLTPLAAAAP